MKNHEIADCLKKQFSEKSEIESQVLKQALQDLFPTAPEGTISWRLNQLTRDNLIHKRGRGLYSFDYKPDFTLELSLKSRRLYNRVNGLHSGKIVVWDTLLLNEITSENIPKYWVFLATNKDNLGDLFDQMKGFSKPVYLQPDKETITRYLIPQDEAIILTALISETPTERSGDYLSPSIEGILVNAWFEHEQYLQPIGLDIHKLYEQAFAKYNVNKSKLLRYAARRDKRKEINELLKTIE